MAYKIVNCKAIKENIQRIKSKLAKNVLFCAVVKSNAYGHGVEQVVKTINPFVDYFAVANCSEVKAVRLLSEKPILVLGALTQECLCEALSLGAEFNVFKVQDIDLLISSAKKLNYDKQINVHISINSGMNRLGVDNLNNLKKLIKNISKYKNLHIKGFFSHISDCNNKLRLSKQINTFEEFWLKELKNKGVIRHIESTSVIQSVSNYDMVRVGIGMYGYDRDFVNPVMDVYAQIVEIKNIKKGEYIGYGSNHTCKKNTKIAVLDIGYADGFLRKNAKGGKVIINNKFCDVVGEVCMSMTFVDVSNVKCKINDKAIILGKSKDLQITANDLCKDSINYEVLTSFSTLKNI